MFILLTYGSVKRLAVWSTRSRETANKQQRTISESCEDDIWIIHVALRRASTSSTAQQRKRWDAMVVLFDSQSETYWYWEKERNRLLWVGNQHTM